MLKLNDISRQFRNQKGEVAYEPLIDIDLVLPSSGLFVLQADDKRSSSELLALIGGIDKPTTGDILFERKSIYESYDTLINYRREAVSFLDHDKSLFEGKTICQCFEIATGKKDSSTISELLSDLGIRGYENKKIDELSSYEKLLVSLGIATRKGSKILLADDPFSSLHESEARSLLSRLKLFSKDHLVILSCSSLPFEDPDLSIITIEKGIVESAVVKKEEEEKQFTSSNKKRNLLSPKEHSLFALSSLRKNKGKAAVTFSLFTLSLLSLGATLSFTFYPKKATIASTLSKAEDDCFTIQKEIEPIDLKKYTSTPYGEGDPYSAEEIDAFSKEIGLSAKGTIPSLSSTKSLFFEGDPDSYRELLSNISYTFFPREFSDAPLLFGEEAKETNEVTLSYLAYRRLQEFGYFDGEANLPIYPDSIDQDSILGASIDLGKGITFKRSECQRRYL